VIYKFEKEVELIANEEIKIFTKRCIEAAPRYVFNIPSSSSGKHHPKDENNSGGQVLHTRRVVKIAEDLCRNFNIVGDDRDCVISAAIQHDFAKQGFPIDVGYTVDGHGSLWVQLLNNVVDRKEILKNPIITKIGRLIACHMGVWDIPYSVGRDNLELIVQLADYISSRDYIRVEVY